MHILPNPILALTAAAVFLVAASACPAGPADGVEADLVQASLLADADAAIPGKAFTLGIRLKMKPHWHTYWINPGESGDPTRVKVSGPAGFTFGAVQWPLPSQIAAPGGTSYGYEDEVLLLLPVTVAKDAVIGGKATIDADVSWLVCKEACIPGKAKLSITLPVQSEAKPANRELFETWQKRLPIAQDQPSAGAALAGVEQANGADGAPQPALAVRWSRAPRKVEFFPVSTRAVAVEDVVVRHDGQATRIEFKPTVYKPEQVPGGRVDGVLVYEDADGRRHGLTVPVRVAAAAAERK